MDRRLARATREVRRVLGPGDDGPLVGYWGIIFDPHGNALELSYGQEVGLVVDAPSPEVRVEQMLPLIVEGALERASSTASTLSCEEGVGRLLAALAAAVPPEGRVLELGTGAGVGLSWILSGLGDRTDVRVTSVESDADLAARSAAASWPSPVSLEKADALEVLARPVRYHLVFADAQGGKWEGLSQTIGAVAEGGILVVDDMRPAHYSSDEHRDKTAEVRARLLSDDRLVAVELHWSSGVILAVRRRRR